MNESPPDPNERLGAARAVLRSRLDDKLADVRWSLMLRGVVLGAMGIFVIFWPQTGLAFLTRVVGAFLIADGAAGVFGAVAAKDRSSLLVQGALSLLFGAVLVFWPEATSRTLMMALGAWALLEGLSVLWQSRELDPDAPEKASTRTVGVVLAAIGVAFVFWPGTGVVTLAWVIGAGALVIAAVFVWLSRKLKSVRKRLTDD